MVMEEMMNIRMRRKLWVVNFILAFRWGDFGVDEVVRVDCLTTRNEY